MSQTHSESSGAVPGRFKWLRRLGWAGIAQSASSGTNFVVGILIARQVSARDFGAFGVAMAVFSTGIAVLRGAASQPLLLRHQPNRAHDREALSFAAWSGGALGVLLAVCALPTSGAVRTSLWVLAVFLPVLLYQDTLRFTFFNVDNPRRVALMDMTWGVVSAAAIVAVSATGHLSLGSGMALWGLGAAASLAVGTPRAWIPSWHAARAWAPVLKGDGGKLALDTLIANGSTSIALMGLGGVASIRAVASFRGARTLLGPAQLVAQGAETVIVPIVARNGGVVAAWRAGRTFALVTAPALCLFGIALGALPSRIGRQLLGASWSGTAPVLAPLGAALGIAMVWYGAELFMRVAGRIGLTVRIRIVAGIATIAAVLVGGAYWGAVGAAWATFAVNAGATVALWLLARPVLIAAASSDGDRR